MTEAKWTLLVLFVVLAAFGIGYCCGAMAEDEVPMAPTKCALCGDPLGEYAVTVLPNETTPFTEPVMVCAKCYRRAVGVDDPGEGKKP